MASRFQRPISKQLLLAALALLRCGTLSSLSRYIAHRVDYNPSASGTGTSSSSTDDTPTVQAVMVSRQLLNALGSLGQVKPPDVLHQALLDALESSSLLEHLSRLTLHALSPAYAAAHRSTVPGSIPLHYVAASIPSLDFLFSSRAMWRALRARLLPGPRFHHLMTAAAVEVMADLDGGPRHGLPPTAITRLLKATEKPKYYYGKILQGWALMLMPECDQPLRQGYLGLKMVYGLCLRTASVCAAAVRSLDRGVWPGDDGRSGQTAGEQTAGEQTAGSSGGESRCSTDGGGGSGASASASTGPAAAQGGQRASRIAPITTGARKLYATAGMAAAAGAYSVLREVGKRRRAGMQAIAQAVAAGLGEGGQAGGWEDEGRVLVPLRWWRTAVEALELSVVPADAEYAAGDEGDDWGPDEGARSLLSCALFHDRLALAVPALLPASPPPDVAAAVASGLVPCLEHLLRGAFRSATTAPELDFFFCSMWDQRAWLAAYAEPRVTAALVATTFKVGLKLQSLSLRTRTMLFPSFLLRDGLAWAAMRQGALHAADSPKGGADASTSASAAAAASGSADSCAATLANADEPGGRLLLMLSCVLDRGLAVICTTLAGELDAHGKLAPAAAADTIAVDMTFATNLLIALGVVLAMLDAGSVNGAHGGSLAAPAPRLTAADADAWRGLLLEAGAPDTLCSIAGAAARFGAPTEVAGLLRRVLPGVIRHCTEAMRSALSRSAGVFPALEQVFGPAGCAADRELLRALRALRDGGRGPSAPVASGKPQRTVLLLPPLSEVRSLLRTCANRRCTNLAGCSEADLVPQPGGGPGGSRSTDQSSGPWGKPEDDAPRCCSLVCREEVKRARRAVARGRA